MPIPAPIPPLSADARDFVDVFKHELTNNSPGVRESLKTGAPVGIQDEIARYVDYLDLKDAWFTERAQMTDCWESRPLADVEREAEAIGLTVFVIREDGRDVDPPSMPLNQVPLIVRKGVVLWAG